MTQIVKLRLIEPLSTLQPAELGGEEEEEEGVFMVNFSRARIDSRELRTQDTECHCKGEYRDNMKYG